MEVTEENETVVYADLDDSDGLESVGLNIDLSDDDNDDEDDNNVHNSLEELELIQNEDAFLKSLKPRPTKKKKKTFPCLMCSRKFSQNAGRYNHMRKVHHIYSGEKSNVRCLEKGCSFTCNFKEKLQTHLASEHGIEMEISLKKFEDLQDFLRWKDEFERQEKSRFVKKSGARVRDEGFRIAYYYCSRSGSYVSQSKGKKKSKLIGTSKSRNHCTASITVVELPCGKIEVKTCSTHYGHENDLQHLRLTQTEKFQIAEQLCRGVPRELVLDSVRASAGSEVDRIHLITMKDVRNIEKAYGIQSSSNEKTTNMFQNLNVWVTSILETEHCPVIYFNESGITDTKTHDVTVIVSTAGQLEAIRKFGRPGVFYVAVYVMHNKQPSYSPITRPNSIALSTLMLLDDMNEAVPVSFMITDNIKFESNKFSLFFETLKCKVPEMSAHTLFTDDREEIFSAWRTVFNDEPEFLWCNRFVDNDWRDNLVNIPDEELQVSIYESLITYLESSDKVHLETTLKNYIQQLQNEEVTSQFSNYFVLKYLGFEKRWAGCYSKKFIGVNAQLNMAACCDEIEEVGAKKHWDRNFIVRIIQNLLKIVSERQCVRHSKMLRQVQELPSHHKLAMNISLDFISHEGDSSWRVNSVKDPNIFAIVTLHSSCSESGKCAMLCSKCKVCAHQFKCSCGVYSFDKTMCKHIHAIALNSLPKLELPSEISGQNEISVCNNETASNSKETDSNCSYLRLTSSGPEEIKSSDYEPVYWKVGKVIKGANKLTRKTGEAGVLPAVAEILNNKSIRRRKRRISSTEEDTDELENETENVGKDSQEKKSRKPRKPRTSKMQKIQEENKNDTESSQSRRRPNILRKCRMK